MELVLIRHTRCDIAAGTCYGHLDVPLPPTADANIARTLLNTPHVDAVYSSPSQRCHRLATALARRDDCALHVREDLRELHFGDWEGQRWDDIPRSMSDAWALDPWNHAPPNGECERELWARVVQAINEIGGNSACNRVAIVSHGGPLRALRCLLAKTSVAERWSWNIECGEVVRITHDTALRFTVPAESGCLSSES